MKKVILLVTLWLSFLPLTLHSQTASQIITLKPAEGYDGVRSYPVVKLFFAATDSLVLEWDKALPAGTVLRIGSSTGNYSWSYTLAAGSKRAAFIPGGGSLQLTTRRYYAIITNSSGKTLSSIQTDAVNSSSIWFSNEIQFIMESPSAPTPTAPRGTITTSTPVFQWNTIPGVPSYWLIVSSTPFVVKTDSLNNVTVQGANVVWDYIVSDNLATYGQISPYSPFTKSAIPLFPGNTYYYTILNLYDPTDVSYASSTFGGVVSFTYQSDVSISVPQLDLPADNQTFPGTATIRFQWDPIPSANSYTIYLFNRVMQFAGSSQQLDLPMWNSTTTNTIIDFAARQNLLNGTYVWFVVPNTATGAGNQSAKRTFYYSTAMGVFTLHLKNAADNNDLINYSVDVNSTTQGYSPAVPYIVSNSSSMSDSIPGDVYQFTAHKTGFFDSTFTYLVNGTKSAKTDVYLYVRQYPSSVTGKVVDQAGNALQGAGVQFTDIITQASSTIYANSTGSFSISLPKATYYVNVSLAGYLSPAQTTVTVDQSQIIVSQPFVLTADNAAIAGTVLNESGAPVQLAVVRATKGSSYQEVTSGGNGNYSFTLSSGTWTITVSKAGFVSPNPLTVNLATGDNLQNQNLALTSRANQVNGTVYKISSSGSQNISIPFAGATVTAVPVSGSAISGTTNSGGQYSLNLPSGSYQIISSAQGYTAANTPQVTLAVGQTMNGVDFSMNPNSCTVTGVVADQSGAAIGSALISDGSFSATSLPTGSYQLSLTAGTHVLSVVKSGYVTPQTITITLSPGQNLSGINFTMNPNAASISGSVTSLGNVITGATIYATSGALQASANTDANGNFVLNVQPGSWTIYAAKAGFFSSAQETFYVGAGQSSINHVYSLASNSAAVKGTVQNTTSPLGGATVTAKDKNNGANIFSTVTDINGGYSLSLTAGTDYSLSISRTGYISYTASVSLQSAGTTGTVNAVLSTAPAIVNGKVLDNQQQAVNQAKVYLINPVSSALVDSVVTDVSGSYSIGSNSGPIKLKAVYPGYTRDSISVTLTQGQVLSNVNFKVTPNFAFLSGTVKDQRGSVLQGAIISLTAANGGGTAQSGSDGSFTISQLIGGTYTVSVKLSGYSDYTSTAFIINDGESKSLTATLQKLSGSISGIVKDASGNPVAQATVTALDTVSGNLYTSTTAANGTYAMSNLAYSTYTISAAKNNYSSAQTPSVTLSATSTAGTANITDLVQNSAQIIGKLTDYAGNSIPAATITVKGALGSGNATTDLNGNFTIANLASGTYQVTAQKQNYVTDSTSQVTNISFIFKLQQSNVVISGTVTNQSGQALPFTATVKASSGQITLTTSTDASGNFSFTNANPGTSYDVYTNIFKDGYTNVHQMIKTSLTGSATTGVNLQALVKNAQISGNVGIASASVSLKLLSSTDSTETNTVSGSDGSFSVNYLLNGTYRITPFKPGYIFSPVSADKAVDIGGTVSVTFSASQNAGNLTLNASDAKGVALDSAFVSITSTNNLYAYSGYTKSGTLVFSNIPAAQYVLQVTKTGYTAQNIPRNTTVNNNAGTTEAVSLQLNTAAISGVVKTTLGAVKANVPVTFQNTGTGLSLSTVSKTDGTFSFANLPSGNATISANLTGFSANTLQFTLAQGDAKTGTITLTPTSVQVNGTVTYAGSGLVNATVTAVSSVSLSVSTGSNGSFSFANLPISITAGDTTYYTFTLSGTDFQPLSQQIAIPASQVGSTINLKAFAVPDGKITLKITDGVNALAGVTLTFVYPDGSQSQIVTDNTGTFNSPAKLAAGSYKVSLAKDYYLIPGDAITTFNLATNDTKLSTTIPLTYKINTLSAIDVSSPSVVSVSYKGTLPAGTAWLKYSSGSINDSIALTNSAAESALKGTIPALHSLSPFTYYAMIRENAGAIYTSASYTLTPEAGGILSSIAFSPAIDKATLRVNDTYQLALLLRDGKNQSLVDSFANHPTAITWSSSDAKSVVFTYPNAKNTAYANVTISKAGTYKITATATLNGFTSSQDATVTAGTITLKSISVTTGTFTLSNKAKGLQFGYTGLDTSQTSVVLGTGLSWSINPPQAGTIDSSGFFKPADSTYIGVVTGTAIDKVSGKSGSADITVYADVNQNSNIVLTDKQGMTLQIKPNAVTIPARITLGKAQFGPGKKYYTPVGASNSYVVSDKQYLITYSADSKIPDDTIYTPLTLQVPIDNSLRSFDGDKTIGVYNTSTNAWDILATTAGTSDATLMTTSLSRFGEYSILVSNDPLGIQNAAVLPTPFSPLIGPVKIGYKLNSQQPPASVTIRIFNMRGELVRTVIQNDLQNPGLYGTSHGVKAITWDGKTENGKDALNGRYIIQIVAKDPTGEAKQIIPVVLVK